MIQQVITTEKLYEIIGKQHVEIVLLNERNIIPWPPGPPGPGPEPLRTSGDAAQ